MEENIFYEGQVLWSQIDANVHLRHSAYADFCAQARSNMLNKLGLSLEEFNKRKKTDQHPRRMDGNNR